MNKIMKNDRNENLKLFQNLKDNESYSKLSFKLNRLFKNNSIENFYKNLYEDKKYIISNPLGLSDDQNMNNNNFFYNLNKNKKKKLFNLKTFKQYLKKLQLKEDNKIKKNNIVYSLSDNCLLKKKNNTNMNIINIKDEENNENINDNNIIKPKNKKIRYISESPGIGRYNINYSLVFKRVTNIFFGVSSKKPKYKKIELKSYNTGKNFNSSPYKKNISFSSENMNNNNNQKNHCLKFENYTYRKPLINVIYKNKNLNIKDIKKDIKNNNNIKKKLKYNIISFDKMSKRNYSFIINNDVPPIGKYSPNYNLIYSHIPLILIDKNKNNKNNKKYKAHKILHKINVPTEYEIITKLNKNN